MSEETGAILFYAASLAVKFALVTLLVGAAFMCVAIATYTLFKVFRGE